MKRNKPRDNITIIADILTATNQPTTKTQLHYKSKLDSKTFKKYLKMLLDKQLIRRTT